MVQKTVVAGILALSLGAWGCGDDSDGGVAGTGGTAGSGGAAGAGGTAGTGGGGLSNACNQEPDLSNTIAVEFPARFWGCYDTADAEGRGFSTELCLQEPPGGLSPECADCYGDYAECIDTDCGESCNDRGENTTPCRECLATGCTLGLTSCSGVASPGVLPQSDP